MNEELLGCLDDHAELMRATGAAHDAVRVFASVEAARERLSLRRYPRGQRKWSEMIAEARRHLGDAAFDQAWAQGRRSTLEDAIEHANRRIERDAIEAASVT
jgi:hypothetical protein